VREARARDQADVAAADDRDVQGDASRIIVVITRV
jgi:hypothetical protein